MATIELRHDDIVELNRLLGEKGGERYQRIWRQVQKASAAEDEANSTEKTIGRFVLRCAAWTELLQFSIRVDDNDQDECLEFEEKDMNSLEACLAEARAQLAKHRAKFPVQKGE